MATITDILFEKDGVALARTDTNIYMVGIGYRVGQNVDKLNHFVDFIQTKSLEIATHQFNLKTGSKGP